MPPSLLLLPPLSSLFLPVKSPKPSSTLLLKNPKPEPNTKTHNLSLEITSERREISHVSYSKSRNFNTEVVVGEDDDAEQCLNRFNAQVKRMGLLRECNRRRFHESALEKRKRKARQAAWFRRRRKRHFKTSDSSENSKEASVENDNWKSDFWADENSEGLMEEDEEQEKKDMEVCLEEDGHGTWELFDKLSHI